MLLCDWITANQFSISIIPWGGGGCTRVGKEFSLPDQSVPVDGRQDISLHVIHALALLGRWVWDQYKIIANPS